MAKRYFCIILLFFIALLLGNYFTSSSIEEIDNDCIDNIEDIIDDIVNDTIIEDTIPVHIDIRDKIVETFRTQIGVRQTGPNTGPEIDEYLASVNLGPGYAWCGAFAAWGYIKHDIPIPEGAAWTPSWFTKNITDNPERADVGGIYFQSLGRIAHIVVYEENWEDTRNTVTTIEGNTNTTGDRTGDGVYRKYRSKRQIRSSANWINN